ncbi:MULTISPECIES: PspC domain-containing protein [Novosphingobium]|uniref:PspC domain-containing protein n=1 Tax=Novosphingobium decolorationis TaxID=2698673 RepID=A0ABX8E697_9SPHN|nr:MULTISPECIES: PspC domain-containing protein [Novosphingobium]MED5543999.1 PspC domain-containing protein [Pseudomonadota bacterium]QVM84094.1 PspC domain-containing protein [Novosphingobium decolorationis]GAM05050.1 phage shock protein C [Novosphingobium sp. MBES04]
MSRGHFYLDKSNAKLAGVCAGIADFTDVDALWIRLGAVLLLLFGFPIVIAIYIAVALIADKRPLSDYSAHEEERLLRRMERRRAKKAGIGRGERLRGELSDIDRRVADMEAHYSNSNSRLAAEIESLR